MTISDLHLGHPNPKWSGFGENVIARARELAAQRAVDVVLCAGDIVEPEAQDASLDEGLRELASIRASHHLWVAGNNDIEQVCKETGSSAHDFAVLLETYGMRHGVRVLDNEPVVLGELAFVGGHGGSDMSLWKPSKHHAEHSDKTYPATLDEVRIAAEQWHIPHLGVTMQELFEISQKALRAQMRACKDHRIVLTTHTVPHPGLVRYNHSARRDFLNGFAGWDDTVSAEPLHTMGNIVRQFCGHTHRCELVSRPGYPHIINVSGTQQPQIYEIY